MMIDYLLQHLNERIEETQAAIDKYTAAVKQDEAFIAEFTETSPETADIYRDWKEFHQGKVSYFEDVLQVLNQRLAQRLS